MTLWNLTALTVQYGTLGTLYILYIYISLRTCNDGKIGLLWDQIVLCGGQLNVRGVSNFDGSLGDNFVGN